MCQIVNVRVNSRFRQMLAGTEKVRPDSVPVA